MDFSISHFFSVSSEEYMKIYFNPEFEHYIVDHSSLKRRKVLSHEQQGSVITRQVEICSGIELPTVLRKVVGMNDLCYVEHATIDLDKFETRWHITPNYLAGKIKARGTTVLRQIEPDRTARSLQGSVTVSIPFIGRIAENFIIESIRKTYGETARLFDEFKLKNAV